MTNVSNEAENLRSIWRFYFAVCQELTKLAIDQVPPKEVVAHLFHIAWISGIAAYEDGVLSREKVMEIERSAYAYASNTIEKEDENLEIFRIGAGADENAAGDEH